MSAKDMARRVELRLKFQNVKVPADINKYLSSLTFTDEDEDNADDLQLAFDDRERKWLGSWLEVKPTFVKTTTTVQKQVEAANVVNYVVKKGDTLWAIAKKYLGSGTKYPQIASENNIKNPNLIYPGQVFKITTGGTATQTVTETKETTKKVSDPKLITATIVQKNWHDNGKDAVSAKYCFIPGHIAALQQLRYAPEPKRTVLARNGQAISRTGEEASQQMRSILRILRQR